MEARGKVGIYPIEVSDIRRFSELKKDTDAEYLTEFKHINSRCLAAQEYLTNQLRFHEEEIQIKHIKMSNSIESKIMWIDICENNVRKIFNRAASLRNPSISLINYIPQQLWKRKKDLDRSLVEYKKDNKDFRYIVKAGKDDLLLLTKIINKTYWEETPISELSIT